MPYGLSQLHGADNVATTLGATYAAGAAVIVVTDGSAFPSVPFTAALGSGTAAYEEVVVTSVVGATFALIAPTTHPHPAGELVENTIGAEVLKRLSDFATGHSHTGGLDGVALSTGGGVTDHALLTNVTANQHHTQAHSISGADHSGTLNHSALGSVSADQHHAQSHAIGGADHSGQLAHTALTSIGTNTHPQIDTHIATGHPAFATPAISLGTAAAAGAAATVIRSDATIVAFDATLPTVSGEGDAAAAGSVAVAARRDHVHGRELARPVLVGGLASGGTLTLPGGNDIIVPISGTTTTTGITLKAAGSRATLEFASAGCTVTAGATLLLAGADYTSSVGGTLTLICDGSAWVEIGRSPHTDATVPVTQAFGDAAAAGTATTWAHRNHRHGMPTIARADLPTVPEASVNRTVNQSIATATWTLLSFDAERLDNDVIHDNATNNSRLTCKTAGRYLVWGSAVFAISGTGARAMGIFRNSGGVGAGGVEVVQNTTPGSATQGIGFSLSRITALAVNDYLELHVWQDSGGALNVVSVAEVSAEFGMRWLGP